MEVMVVKEYHVERLMRDAKYSNIEGTSEIQRIVISRSVK